MGKQQSNCKNRILKKFALLLLSLINISLVAQTIEEVDYSTPKSYEIGGIMVNGADNLNNSTLIAISGLTVGETIEIPSDNISIAITKLWKEGLFADINITIDKIVENTVFLNINLKENSRLSKFKFKGKISKSDISTLKGDLKLMRGKILTQNIINNSVSLIKTYYINKGFLNVAVGYLTTIDTSAINSENLIFNINKGKRIKIKEIKIIGRDKIANANKTFFNRQDTVFAISDRKVKKSMKETKAKNWWRIFKVSKFIDKNYTEDKESLIAKYNEVGYRDARVTKDTTYLNKDNTLSIEITIEEGELYKFGKISFVGNKVYTTKELSRQLGIKEGDVFDQSILDARLFGSPEGGDISSLYLDDGYLFFNATPVEVAVNNKNIDLEIRIYEGKQARVNKVIIKGNTKTNDHVIMREIRTRPGDLFKRSDIMRSQRELAQMKYFNPEGALRLNGSGSFAL